MAGLYGRMVDPNFAAPVRGGQGSNAGIGAQAAPRLQSPQDDDFNAAQMAGLLGLIQKAKKPGEDAASAAPGAALDAAQPGMAPITNQGNFDMAPAMAGQLNAPDTFGNAQGGFTMPPAGSGDAFQLGNVGGAAPLMSNFGAGIPTTQAAPVPQGMAMPTAIGGAGVPTFGGAVPTDPSIWQQALNGIMGFFGGAGA